MPAPFELRNNVPVKGSLADTTKTFAPVRSSRYKGRTWISSI